MKSIIRTIGSITIAALISLPLVACETRSKSDEPTVNERDRGSNVVPARASPAAQTQSATSALTQSRCEREQRCNNIGAERKYSSFEDCRVEVGRDWRDDLNARECTRGVEQRQLNECLVAIRNEDCGNPFDSLERITACTSGQICAE